MLQKPNYSGLQNLPTYKNTHKTFFQAEGVELFSRWSSFFLLKYVIKIFKTQKITTIYAKKVNIHYVNLSNQYSKFLGKKSEKKIDGKI